MASRYRRGDAVTSTPGEKDFHLHGYTVVSFPPLSFKLPAVPEYYCSLRLNESHQSLITVTDGDSDGNGLVQMGLTIPILARWISSPFKEKPVLVKVAACWLDFFLNLGGLTFLPLRSPLQELKKFWKARANCLTDCLKAQSETSLSHLRSSVFLICVNCRSSSNPLMALPASRHAASASFQTTRLHPNCLASANRWDALG